MSKLKNGTSTDLSVELWPITKPIPYARNARKITQAAIDKVAASIQEFGFRQPIVVDTNRVVLAGHTRLLAAQKLGLTEVPIHVAADLTVAQAKAYRLADNRAAQEATWDQELLALELEDLKADEFDLALTGLNADELNRFTNYLSNDVSPDRPNRVVIGAQELDRESFQDFAHKCPKCGFEFDK